MYCCNKTKPLLIDNSRVTHDFFFEGGQALLPLIQSALAIAYDTTRFCWFSFYIVKMLA